MRCRGVARILERGFPWAVDPRREGLGAVPPDADNLLYIMRRKIMIFDHIYMHWLSVSIHQYHYIHQMAYLVHVQDNHSTHASAARLLSVNSHSLALFRLSALLTNRKLCSFS